MILAAVRLDCGKVLPILDVCKFALTAIQWVAPILLILWGSIDLIRSIIAGKEDEIKKHQKTIVTRLISAVILFLVPVAVSLVLGLIGSSDWKSCWGKAKPQIVSSEQDINQRIQEGTN